MNRICDFRLKRRGDHLTVLLRIRFVLGYESLLSPVPSTTMVFSELNSKSRPNVIIAQAVCMPYKRLNGKAASMPLDPTRLWRCYGVDNKCNSPSICDRNARRRQMFKGKSICFRTKYGIASNLHCGCFTLNTNHWQLRQKRMIGNSSL